MLLSMGAVLSLTAAAISFGLLVTGAIASGAELVAVYLAFSVFVVAGLHFAAFAIVKSKHGVIDRRVLQYLDYACLGLLAIGLLDIVTFAPRYYHYLQRQVGEEAAVLESIRSIATEQIAEHCNPPAPRKSRTDDGGTVFTFYYTQSHCESLRQLAEANTNATAIGLAKDTGFTLHITEEVLPLRPQPVRKYTNTVVPLIKRIATLAEFRNYPDDQASDVVLTFISMLLLPLALGFSAVKTSLELCGQKK